MDAAFVIVSYLDRHFKDRYVLSMGQVDELDVDGETMDTGIFEQAERHFFSHSFQAALGIRYIPHEEAVYQHGDRIASQVSQKAGFFKIVRAGVGPVPDDEALGVGPQQSHQGIDVVVLKRDIRVGEQVDIPCGLFKAFFQGCAFPFVDGQRDAMYIFLPGKGQGIGAVGGAVVHQDDLGGIGLEPQPFQEGGDMFFQQVAAVVDGNDDADLISNGGG